MRILCIAGVFGGAGLMLYNIIYYYRSLVRLRQEAYAKKTFSSWSYTLCMALMVFFLAGYLTTGVFFLSGHTLMVSNLLITAILFFGAIFVMVVLQVQSRMTGTINEKTDEIIKTLVNAMEAKDRYTRGHSVHVANLVRLFYSKLPSNLQNAVNREQLMDAAILHDIGKIGIPDIVLNKPGKLNDEEMALIRTHPRLGKEILEHTSFADLGDIVLMHHERMDQQGYYRIPVDQIPIESRIISIADTFSALYSDRVYRPRKTFAQTMEILGQAAGTQLDPELVGIFCSIPEAELLECSRDLFVLEQEGTAVRTWFPTAEGKHSTK